MAAESIHRSRGPLNHSCGLSDPNCGAIRTNRGFLGYSHGLLDPNCGAIRTNRGLPCRLGMDARPTHLDVRIEKTHPNVVIQTMSAEASSKTAASRRCSGECLPVRPSSRVAA